MTIEECNDQQQWDSFVRDNGGHPLQLWGWGELKSAHNWRAYRYLAIEQGSAVGGAQVLRRATPKPFRSLLYVPRGPVGSAEQILPALTDHLSTTFQATHVSIEPHQTKPLSVEGWRSVDKAILLPRTIVIDLSRSEDELQADMAKKTRQYIRKSTKEGVTVRVGSADDIPRVMEIYRQTAERANFGLHGEAYYTDLHRLLGEASVIYVAEHEGKIVSFLWLVYTPAVAFELYGGVNDTGQRVRANYTLKWHALQDMKDRGVAEYDMNGLLNDGVSGFKQSFASHETQLIGTYDYPLSSWYGAWHTVFPVAKKLVQTASSLRK